ncbi:hypothetical protein ACEWY4_001240 [Coilia grayii]|uniref:Transcription factor Adf-1-like n=1 Tax=Coilia grayii TaxID=363190 RepID=A0ABD1KYZ2_9TELE
MAAKTKSKIPTEQLVVLVSEHSELYDMANKLYHNVYHKETVWRSIGTLLGHSWEDCRDKWKYLRGKYGKERKEAKERRSGAVGGPKTSWKYVNILSFLEPYIQDRPTASNCQVESETAETILNRMDDSVPVSPSESSCPPQIARPSPSPPQQQQQQEVGPVRTGRKRQAAPALSQYQQQVLSAIAKEEDEHERFLLSFAPALRRLEPRKQALLKCRMQALFFDIEFGGEE